MSQLRFAPGWLRGVCPCGDLVQDLSCKPGHERRCSMFEQANAIGKRIVGNEQIIEQDFMWNPLFGKKEICSRREGNRRSDRPTTTSAPEWHRRVDHHVAATAY